MTVQKDKYINPLTDFGFKKLFGSEPNKLLLIDFLNQILPDRTVKNLSYSTNEHLGKSELDRKAIFDLYCIGEQGERFIVEMQKAKQNYFKDRSIYYASFPIQEQAKKSEWNYKLDPVYSIGILDFIFEDHKNDTTLLHTISLKDQDCNIFYDKLKFVYIELPKFTKKEAELKTQLDKWLYVFRHLSKLQERPEKLQERVFKKLFAAAEIAKFTPKEREAYEESLKYYRDMKNVVDSSKQEGFQEGVEKGIQRGIQRGIEKGSKNRALEIAQQMQKEGFSVEQIQRITGLSINELTALD